MDTYSPDGFAMKSTCTFRRWAATAGTGSLIAMAAYVALRPGALARAAEPASTPIAAAIAPVVTSASTPAMANLVDDTVAVLGRTFTPTTMPSTDAWLSLFPKSETQKDAVADTTTNSVPSTIVVTTTNESGEVTGTKSQVAEGTSDATVPAAVDAAARTAAADLVWTPTGVVTPATTTGAPTATPALTTTGATTTNNAATPAEPAPIVSSGLSSAGRITLSVNRTADVRTSVPVKRVSVGQPEVADVSPLGPNVLLVTAKKPGVTQVIVWDDQDRSQSIDINVEIPLEQLRELVSTLAPGSNIQVSVANDQIVLRGQAPNLTIAKNLSDVAGAYGKVQNFIEVAGAQTVAVQVQFAEVSRNVTSNLGVSWAYQDGVSVFGSDPSGSGQLGYGVDDNGFIQGWEAADRPGGFNFFGVGSASGNPFTYFVKALRDNSLLRVLQEPTLTTTSGEPASFLAGGQVAVPVPADNGSVGIEYKEFGVRLKLTPIVLGNGKIRLIMEAESSELDYANGTKIKEASVPGLRTRRVTNTIEMGEGQTLSVAGLLDDSVTATKQSVPGLGDIPVLGQLFRSTRYQRKETELVVLITPRLAGAMNPDQVPPLPGANWRHPNELEQFALGDMGGNAEADAVKDWNKPASERGLKPGTTQKNTPSKEAAAQTRANAKPPMFMGEHGFNPDAGDTATTSARD